MVRDIHYIEVKGRIEGSETFTIRLEWWLAPRDRHRLALVKVSAQSSTRDRLYVRARLLSSATSATAISYSEIVGRLLGARKAPVASMAALHFRYSKGSTVTSTPKKLIEPPAPPLEAIQILASIREKSIRHPGHRRRSTFTGRRSLRGDLLETILFAQLVDDPASRPEEFPTVEAQDAEQAHLRTLIERLVIWEEQRG